MTYLTHQIEDGLSLQSQSVIRTWIGKIRPSNSDLPFQKIRAMIKSDSYDFQSYGRVQVWSPQALKWITVYEIPYTEMKTPFKLAYYPSSKQKLAQFHEDLHRLLDRSFEILF